MATIAQTYNNISLIYVKQLKFEEAERNHKKALQIRQNIFGEHDVSVADSFNNIAIVYNKLK